MNMNSMRNSCDQELRAERQIVKIDQFKDETKYDGFDALNNRFKTMHCFLLYTQEYLTQKQIKSELKSLKL